MVDRIGIAVAALVWDGQVLLVHRHPSRRAYPDRWDLVGGHIEAGELPVDAVTRECLEELGVHVHDPTPMEFASDDRALALHAFLVTRWDGEPRNLEPEEHDGLRWFGAHELADLRMAHPAGVPALLRALEAESVGQDRDRA